ncbi:MAG: response regulator [Chloroflexi bacterium]|nr:response regulator [Chloroflexota bacterium]
MGRIKVYLADRRALFRKGLHFALSNAGEVEVIGETGSNEEAFRFVESNPPDVAILTINDSRPSGIEVTRSIKQNLPSVSVILVMDHEDDEQLFSAMRSGASACITRDIDPGNLATIIKEVSEGTRPISKALLRPAVARRVLKVEDVLAELSVDEADILIRVVEKASGEVTPEALSPSGGSLNLRLASILSKLMANEPPPERAVEPEAPRVYQKTLSVGSDLTRVPSSEQASRPALAEAEAEVAQPSLAQSEASGERTAEASAEPATAPKDGVSSALKEVPPAIARPVPAPIAELIPAGSRENVGASKVIEALLAGSLTEIDPEIDLALEDGFTYPQADKVLGTSGRATLQMLELLAKGDVLVKRLAVRLFVTPEGSPHLIPQEHCPRCDSNDMARGQFVEHSDCGYAGLDSDFQVAGQYVCPKCKGKPGLTGTDYRRLGARCRCNNCHGVIPAPTMKFLSFRTGRVYARDELQEVALNSYCFSPSIDFQLNSKWRLIDFLSARGYQVEESAKLVGKSGMVHSLDILATKDEMIVKHQVAVGVLTAGPGKVEVPIDDLWSFQAKAVDTGIHDLIVIAITRLSPQARDFAGIQRIRVLGAKDIMTLSPGQSRSTQATETVATSRVRPETTGNAAAQAPPEANPASLGKVLWIDRDLAFSAKPTRALEIAGFEVMAFADTEEGLQRVKDAGLVVLDDELSRVGEVYSQIRHQSSVPVILLGSERSEEVHNGPLSLGADAYLRRSISGRELVARIRAIFRRYQNSSSRERDNEGGGRGQKPAIRR